MANRTLLLGGISAAGLLPLLLTARPAEAAKVVFSVNCRANQATPTLSNFCTGTNSTQSNPTFGIATPTGTNKNSAQKFAVDLETPTQAIPNTNPNYATRYIWNTGTPTSPATASTTQTVTDPSGMVLNGLNYTTAPTGSTNGGNNVVRVNYFDRPGSSVSQQGTNFTRPLAFTFNSFALGGTCSVCGPSMGIVTADPMYGIGRWIGNGSYNSGTGTYSFISDTTRINIGSSKQGLLQYRADVTIQNGIVLATSGQVTIDVFVPSPLPILGGGIAFSWSRRLRRRISQVSA
jgi:hypothetical protein